MPTFLLGPPKKSVGLAVGQASAGVGRRRLERAARRVLIVEDEAMIAGWIESILRKGGWSVVGPVATLKRALEAIERERLDAALLDVRINGHDAFAVADVLMKRNVPFVFVSGFTRKQMPPATAIAPTSPSRSRRMRFWRCWRRSWGKGGASRTGRRTRSSEETMASEHDHLAQAIRHIARAEEMVMQQRDLIDRMAHHRQDTKLAETLLLTMQNSLEQMHEHRAMIERAIAAGRK